VASIPHRRLDPDVSRELHEKALRHCVWLGILHAQLLGEVTVGGQLAAILVLLDEQRAGDPARG